MENCKFEVQLDEQLQECLFHIQARFVPNDLILTKFEELLHFLESLKQDVFVFDNFNLIILKFFEDRKNYEDLITAFDLEAHDFEPTSATDKFKSCINRKSSNDQLQTETVPTTVFNTK